MKRDIFLGLLLLLLSSCGFSADGGGRGTGITSTIQGNVASVQNSGTPMNDVEGIRVTVMGRAAHGVSDQSGVFAVQGQYEANLTLLFTRRSDHLRAQISVDVPAEGTLTVSGVHVDNLHGTATADSQQVEFLGKIIQVNCSAQTLTMIAAKHAPNDSDTYLLQLNNSSVTDSQGNPVSCSQISDGEVGSVQATVNPDGSYGNARVVLE